jgi:methionyl-tRNA formyltransferase
MIPADLELVTLDLPPADTCPIVVLTGREIRHDRFALRLQSEFPGLVVAWLQVVPAVSGAQQARRDGNAQSDAEQRLFGEELDQLRKQAYIEPKIVQDPNAAETVRLVKSLDPYFILTLGGAIYGKELRECARGLAINQHDGWCPEYRGSHTVNWAMYHRDLSKVANTVHVLTEGMDSGPILRRSIVCLAEDDTLESAFARSVALGTELVCETVRELITTKRARIFPQPQFIGHTYLARQMDQHMQRGIEMDLQRDFIARDIAKRASF